MKIGKCRNCSYFKKKNLEGTSLWYKFTSVCGFCMDSGNPDFNPFAKIMGRGITNTQSLFGPKWCRLRGGRRHERKV